MKQDICNLGRENFKREILFDFDNFEDMDNKEKELVTEEFIAREDTYNIRLGGQNPEVDRICAMGNDRQRELWQENGQWSQEQRKKRSERMKRIRREQPERFARSGGDHLGFLGKHHTEETKSKIREKAKLRIGEKNNAFGTVWIYNENFEQNKNVKKKQVDDFLNQGWKLGRKMKFYEKFHNG